MTPPRVSVLLPCHDAADTLDEAMGSIAAQTFRDFEVVAVDDGSTDATAAMLDRWGAHDNRIHSVTTPRRGIVAALNTAVSYAVGEVLARMDADDVAAPRRLERQLAYLDAHHNVVACGTQVRYVPTTAVREGAARYEEWINGVVTPEEMERDLFVECPIPHPTLVVWRDAFEAVGGYLDVGWPEDYDLLLRLWQGGFRFGKVPEVLLDWREGPGRLSRNDERYDEDAFRRCKVHFLRRRIAGRRVVVWGAGPVGKAFARALRKVDQQVAAFVDLDPRKIGQMIHDAPVVHPGAVGEYRDAYVMAAVGSPTARAEIRGELHSAGFREPEDCCAVA